MPTLNNELNLNDWREIMIAKDTASDAKEKADECWKTLMDYKTAINGKFDVIRADITNIKENHLAHVQSSINSIDNKLIEHATNQKWIMIIGAFLIVQGTGILIAVLFG